MEIDAVTRSWIRNAADEKAAAEGMRFDSERGQFVCDWIESNCCLYEGDLAGQPMRLMPYEHDFIMRLFGWVRWSVEYNCWIRRFTWASLWCAKKNGKSPLLAAIGLYLTCADGELGQKVYTAAKNGTQAQISQRHAVAMVEQSPKLNEECRINKTTLQISHTDTRSMMLILSGDDTRGAKAREGINGSVLIDECHVFDREMYSRTSRAGISRREPFNLAVSTAGDDPSSYGHERYQYGQQVNKGDRDDLTFLHVEYSVSAKVTESEIDERLEELGRQANPAWGHIVKPSEFRADWNKTKGNPREVALFKQYRLNLWIGSTSPWLDMAGWELGRREYTPDDLRGRRCYAGIDLSRTRDMTSVVFLFPWIEDDPEAIRIWPLFWLPEITAQNRDHLFPFRSWAGAGHLTLTRGDVVDYKQVREDAVAFAEANELEVVKIFFDQHYAEEMTQELMEALRCERVAVSQSLMTLSPIAKELERRVISGLVQHPGNKVMDWQADHVTVWTDRNQNIRPVKPAPTSGKSIDGIMATLDAMVGAIEPEVTYISANPMVA